jgi:hypothetical protein
MYYCEAGGDILAPCSFVLNNLIVDDKIETLAVEYSVVRMDMFFDDLDDGCGCSSPLGAAC